MGIYDRDYYRQPTPRGGFGSFSMLSVTTWLIAINVGVFIIDALLLNQSLSEFPREVQRQLKAMSVGPLEDWGSFSRERAIYHLQLWRVFTYQFLHANLQHLFFNMLSLYFFGPIVESYLGARRYLAFYLLCGCSGAVLFLLLQIVGILPDGNLVGASAAIFGVLIAGAVIAPNVQVMLMFPPVPIQLKYLALILVAIATYTALSNGRNAGGEAAHLGGAVLGYLLIRHPYVLDLLAPRKRPRGRIRTNWQNDSNR
jgi:membrane associated rhomboid family serine protease